jgi:cytochrome c-type biogenesis protein CcsB
MLAVVCYTGEYAFGRKGKVASTSPVGRPAMASVSASGGAGAVSTASGGGWSVGAGRVETSRPSGDRWGVLALVLTVLGGLIHLACLVIRGVAVDRVPWGNMYEFTLVVGLIAVVSWLALLIKLPSLRYLGLFVMLPVLLVMFLAGTLYTKATKLVPALQSYWLAIHVSSVATAEGILMVSAAMTILFLIRSRYERVVALSAVSELSSDNGSGAAAGSVGSVAVQPQLGRIARLGARLPGSDSLDKAAYRTVAFAFPIYTAGVIFGAIWAEAAWGRYWGWDPKETWAFIAWVIYAMYLHARATAGWKGSRAGYINLLGFAALTFNFFVVNIVISGLHSYAGLN